MHTPLHCAKSWQLSFLDLHTLDPLPDPELPMELVSELTFSKSGSLLALVASGASAPQDIWIFDCETRCLWQVTHSPHAGIDLTVLVKPELVHFAAHDGL